jgi:hypothetical protein
MASICSVTFMLASSAAMLEPSLPAQISPVIKGPNERTTACETKDGSHDSAPKEEREGRDCRVNTTPERKAVKQTRNNERLPIS